MYTTPFIHIFIFIAFLINIIGPFPVALADPGFNGAGDFRLPVPGIMVPLSPEFNPAILKGIKIHPDNPFQFDFILDQGDSVIASEAKQSFIKDESTRLIKYFLAGLTIPEKDLWVNLSPYEKNRIVPLSFGQTEMGRDLLAEDYLLKQITASLIYPEDEVGKRFWKRVYEEAMKNFGTTNIPVNTFNKVWIVPEKAVVYENAKAGTAYVVESKLKVMLEEDYLSLEKHNAVLPLSARNGSHSIGANIVREIVIPELTKEVNEDKNFAQLRQVYNSLILAAWYKKKIKDSILQQVYADQNKIAGVGYKSSINVGTIYQRYLQAFKKGVYNYIKEEPDPMTHEMIPRKYFSGGVNFLGNLAMTTTSDPAMVPQNSGATKLIKADIRPEILAPKMNMAMFVRFKSIVRGLEDFQYQGITFHAVGYRPFDSLVQFNLRRNGKKIGFFNLEWSFLKQRLTLQHIEINDPDTRGGGNLRALLGRLNILLPDRSKMVLNTVVNDETLQNWIDRIMEQNKIGRSQFFKQVIGEKVLDINQIKALAGMLREYMQWSSKHPEDRLILLKDIAGEKGFGRALLDANFKDLDVQIGKDGNISLSAVKDMATVNQAMKTEGSFQELYKDLKGLSTYGFVSPETFKFMSQKISLDVLGEVHLKEGGLIKIKRLSIDPKQQTIEIVPNDLEVTPRTLSLGSVNYLNLPFNASLTEALTKNLSVYVHGIEENLGAINKYNGSVHGDVYMGFSGWFNYNLMFKRKVKYAILMDKNLPVVLTHRMTAEVISRSNNRFEFVKNFEKALQGSKIKLGMGSDWSELEFMPQMKDSWLNSDENFLYIKQMYEQGRIISSMADIRLNDVFSMISKWLGENHLKMDTIYVSNILSWLSSDIDGSRKYYDSLSRISTSSTIIIDAPTQARAGGNPLIQRARVASAIPELKIRNEAMKTASTPTIMEVPLNAVNKVIDMASHWPDPQINWKYVMKDPSGSHTFVVNQNGEMVGVMVAREGALVSFDRQMIIDGIEVRKDHQGEGLGRLLVTKAAQMSLANSKTQGRVSLELSKEDGKEFNKNDQEFYEHLHFNTMAVFPDEGMDQAEEKGFMYLTPNNAKLLLKESSQNNPSLTHNSAMKTGASLKGEGQLDLSNIFKEGDTDFLINGRKLVFTYVRGVDKRNRTAFWINAFENGKNIGYAHVAIDPDSRQAFIAEDIVKSSFEEPEGRVERISKQAGVDVEMLTKGWDHFMGLSVRKEYQNKQPLSEGGRLRLGSLLFATALEMAHREGADQLWIEANISSGLFYDRNFGAKQSKHPVFIDGIRYPLFVSLFDWNSGGLDIRRDAAGRVNNILLPDAIVVKAQKSAHQGNKIVNLAMTTVKGGIDLTPANMNVEVRNGMDASQAIKFHLDPSMLQKLQNATGFVPVIINIQPMTDIRTFLGINDPVGVDKSA